MSNFTKKLETMQKSWDAGKERKEEPFELKVLPGKYRAALTDLELKESENSGKLIIRREWTILEGDLADDTFLDFLSIENEWGLLATHRFIESMGYEIPEDIKDLPDLLDAILKEKPECMIKVKIKDDFANVKILELLSSSATGEPEPEGDDLDGLNRDELKETLKAESIEFTVFKNTEDDAIRTAIREARGAPAEPVAEPEPEPEPEAEPEPEPEKEPAKAPAKKGAEKSSASSGKKETPLIDQLRNFAEANDLHYDKKKATEKELSSLIKKKMWKASEMTEKEKALLKKIGATCK